MKKFLINMEYEVWQANSELGFTSDVQPNNNAKKHHWLVQKGPIPKNGINFLVKARENIRLVSYRESFFPTLVPISSFLNFLKISKYFDLNFRNRISKICPTIVLLKFILYLVEVK